MGLGISSSIYGFYPRNNPSGFVTGVDTSNFYTKDNPSGFITSQNVLFTTGDQIISGSKTFSASRYIFSGANVILIDNTGIASGYWQFSNRPTVNDTGILLDGEAYPSNNPSGFITGVDLTPYATVVNLNITGSTLDTKIDNLSGYSNNTFATITKLETTGSNLNQKIDNLSGVSVLIYGNQTISGLKDFAIRPTVNTVPVALSGEAASNIEQFVKNDYGSTLYKAQPVYVSGSNGNNILIHPASNSGEGTSSKTFGLLKQTLLNNEQGYVITEGALLNVDTSMATEGDPIWLGPTGNLIYGLANKPKAPQHLVSLGFVERAHQNQGKIFVKVQNGFELDELHDVRIANKQNSDIIVYNSTSGLWLNSGVNFGSFYTNDNPSGFITNENVVFSTGDQTINGIKNFQNDVQLNTINGNTSFGIYNYNLASNSQRSYSRQEGALPNLASTVSGIRGADILNFYFGDANVDINPYGKKCTLKVNPGVIVDHNGYPSNRNLVKFPDESIYAGKAIRKVRYNSTIGNGYERINLTNLSFETNPATIRPLTRRLETFYDISVPSGGGIRALYFNRPTSTDFVQGLCMNLRFNFEADSDPCVISGYSAGGLVFLLTGANYNFVQKERVILINKGASPHYEFIHW